MATGNVVNGNYILLSVNGEQVAGLQANDESYNTAMRDATIKASMGDSEFAPGLRSAEINCSGVFFEKLKNLLKQTENFENSAWSKDSGITVTQNSGSAPSPYNRKTADLITFNAGNNIIQSITDVFTIGNDLVFSICAKGTGSIDITITDDSTNFNTYTITLTGALTRYFVTHNLAISATGVYISITKNTATSVTVFGAQLEKGTTPTQYLPSGTKLIDLINLELAGTKIPCVISSFVSGEMVDSSNAYISNIKRTLAKDENVTFTCALKVTGSITNSTI